MLSKLKKYATHPLVCLAAGTAIGIAIATTAAGAKAVSAIAAARAKVGI